MQDPADTNALFILNKPATPLDVVRVRLQSQTTIPLQASSLRLSTSSPLTGSNAFFFKQLPPFHHASMSPALTTTMCCRNVTFAPDTVPFCVLHQLPTPAQLQPQDCISSQHSHHHHHISRQFTSTLDGLRKIAQYEGLPTLWQGLSPTLLMAIPSNVIYFTGYDWLRYDPRSPAYKFLSDAYSPFICGSLARVLAATSIGPIEMFRTRLQATSSSSSSPSPVTSVSGTSSAKNTSRTGHFRRTLRSLYQLTQSQGYTSLWRGLTLTMWRDVPFSGMYWFGYEKVRGVLSGLRARNESGAELVVSSNTGASGGGGGQQQQQQWNTEKVEQNSSHTFIDAFISGAVSGMVAAVLTTPFDVGKTRQQVLLHADDAPPYTAPPPSTHNNNASPNTPSHTTSTSAYSRYSALSFKSIASASSSPAPPPRPEQLPIPRFLLHMFREEGLAGLFRGWIPRCLKVAPSCGIMISTYEVGKNIAEKFNERQEGDDV